MPRVESPSIAPPATHRLRLDITYFPNGNEDKDHTSLFPLPPAHNVPTQADRIYTDPYDAERRAIINQNGAEFYYTEFEQGLRHPIKNTLTGECLGKTLGLIFG